MHRFRLGFKYSTKKAILRVPRTGLGLISEGFAKMMNTLQVHINMNQILDCSTFKKKDMNKVLFKFQFLTIGKRETTCNMKIIVNQFLFQLQYKIF